MVQGDRFYYLVGRGAQAVRANRVMAACLSALGAKLAAGCGFRKLREVGPGGVARPVEEWRFHAALPTGEDVRVLVARLRDEKYLADHPESPLAWVKRTAENFAKIEEETEKIVPLARIRKGKRLVDFPIDAPPEERAKFMEHLEVA